ncbi:hypothetical protein D3C72_2133830 [compost metagenome]
MADQFGRRLDVFHAHLVERLRRHAVDQHGSDLVAGQIVERAVVRVARRRQHDAVDPALVQVLHHFEFLLGIVMRIGKQHHQAMARAGRLDGAHGFAEIMVGEGGNGHADGARR